MGATNQITIIGRVGQVPDIRYLDNGRAVAKFSVAVNRPGKRDETDWFNVDIWGKAAEAAERIGKGSLVAVSGAMHSRKHEGTTYWTLSGMDWQFVGPKSDDSTSAAPSIDREAVKQRAQLEGRWQNGEPVDDGDIPPW